MRRCLEQHFAKNGYVHEDVFWRNVGYFKQKGETVVVMLDLSPSRVKLQKDSELPGNWINDAIEGLQSHCSVQLGRKIEIVLVLCHARTVPLFGVYAVENAYWDQSALICFLGRSLFLFPKFPRFQINQFQWRDKNELLRIAF